MFHKMVFIFFLLGWIAPGPAYSAPAAVNIIGVRHWVAPDHVRFVIDIDKEADFRVEKGEKRIAIILDKALFPKELGGLKRIGKPGLTSACLSRSPRGGVRLELNLSDHLPTHVFKLKKFRDKPDRIVVDIDLQQAVEIPVKEQKEPIAEKKEWVVVIDPGHGGDDPGAVGKKGTYEKNVVLDISKRIAGILNRKESYRAVLTRDGDYYVPFKKRLAKAREEGADLFLSVHADASRNRAAQGSSVYCIAEGAASSEAAKILANNENLADIIGGVPAGERSDATDPIILNMFQTHVKNQSRIFGRILLGHMKSLNGLKFDDVQEAPFYVLKLPEITSVLLETAFISNPQEENLLRKEPFREEIARSVTDAIVEFLPPLVDEDKKKKASPPTVVAYAVKGGDTLYSIAARHKTTAAAIQELNNLKRPDLLYVGLKLLIPRKEGQQ